MKTTKIIISTTLVALATVTFGQQGIIKEWLFPTRNENVNQHTPEYTNVAQGSSYNYYAAQTDLMYEDEVEIEIGFVGDREMTRLNKTYMGRVGTTDVLSFPLTESSKVAPESMEFVNPPDGILRLGEIIISYPQARKQAQENNVLVDEEVSRLVQHGLLHLLGIDHE